MQMKFIDKAGLQHGQGKLAAAFAKNVRAAEFPAHCREHAGKVRAAARIGPKGKDPHAHLAQGFRRCRGRGRGGGEKDGLLRPLP